VLLCDGGKRAQRRDMKSAGTVARHRKNRPMALETRPCDPAECRDSYEASAASMTEAIETNDPDLIADALGVTARSLGMTREARD